MTFEKAKKLAKDLEAEKRTRMMELGKIMRTYDGQVAETGTLRARKTEGFPSWTIERHDEGCVWEVVCVEIGDKDGCYRMREGGPPALFERVVLHRLEHRIAWAVSKVL